jgi:hypothetical protein
VATKTSFALFLRTRSSARRARQRSVNAKALVFSVKGEDLLFLDQPNARLDGPDGDDLQAAYARLGLPPPRSARPGSSPRRPRRPHRPPARHRPTSGVTAFWWTLAEFCADELLPYVFADAEDERNQYTMVIHQVPARLRREALPLDDGAVQSRARCCAPTTSSSSSSPTGSPTRTPAATGPDRSPAPAPINAFLRRLRSSLKPLRSIVRGDLTDVPARRVSTEGQQLTVVDLHNLPERAQRFVVGVVLTAETARKEAAGPGGLLFTMIDELNKYAPREGASPIKEVLLDIAERGRSLGIILIGAQQTASEVERRIVSNSSVKVVGRLDPAEAGARSTGSCRPRSGPAPRWPSRARCSSPSPRSRCRWPWSSRSRPGRPGSRRSPGRSSPPGRVPRTATATGSHRRPAGTPSPACPRCRPTTTPRSDCSPAPRRRRAPADAVDGRSTRWGWSSTSSPSTSTASTS